VSKVASLPYIKIIRALQRDSWMVVVRQRGSHIRLQKRVEDEVLKLTVPAHRPVKRSTLSHILKQARLDVEEFLELLETDALTSDNKRFAAMPKFPPSCQRRGTMSEG